MYGSQVTSTSPYHFVGSHVLHRLLVPRHPPCALSNFTKKLYYLFSARNTDSYRKIFVFLFWLSKMIRKSFLLFQYFKEQISGAKRDRTVNLRLARAALYQLSYSPLKTIFKGSYVSIKTQYLEKWA